MPEGVKRTRAKNNTNLRKWSVMLGIIGTEMSKYSIYRSSLYRTTIYGYKYPVNQTK